MDGNHNGALLSSKPVCAASIALNIGAGGPSKPTVLQRRLKGEE